MTRTLATLLPYPAAVELVQEIDRARGREVAVALVGFLLFCDVRACVRQAQVETSAPDSAARKPAVSAGVSGQAQVQVQERML
jgi:hypothetical protein